MELDVLNKMNPTFIVPRVAADFLKDLPVNEFLQYSIYLYKKSDLVQYNKPALFISLDNIRSKNTGYRTSGNLIFEFVNNNTVNNRVSNFDTSSAFQNHLMLNIVNNINFFTKLVKLAPFMTFVSDNYSYQSTRTGFKIIVNVGWLFQIYRSWLEQSQYSPDGTLNELTEILSIGTEIIVGPESYTIVQPDSSADYPIFYPIDNTSDTSINLVQTVNMQQDTINNLIKYVNNLTKSLDNLTKV